MADPLVISRIFAARRHRVFQAWSSADHMKRWFCPESLTVPAACSRSACACRTGRRMRGHFTEVSPFSRLAVETTIFSEEQPLFAVL